MRRELGYSIPDYRTEEEIIAGMKYIPPTPVREDILHADVEYLRSIVKECYFYGFIGMVVADRFTRSIKYGIMHPIGLVTFIATANITFYYKGTKKRKKPKRYFPENDEKWKQSQKEYDFRKQLAVDIYLDTSSNYINFPFTKEIHGILVGIKKVILFPIYIMAEDPRNMFKGYNKPVKERPPKEPLEFKEEYKWLPKWWRRTKQEQERRDKENKKLLDAFDEKVKRNVKSVYDKMDENGEKEVIEY